jgi:prepilin-type N-terminal cleavage/methylation domain-containing protein
MNSRRGFTLAELIMAIALLAFFGVMIVQVFVRAQQLTSQAEQLDRAVVCAADLADQWKRGSDADQDQWPVLKEFAGNRTGRTASQPLDTDFLPCPAANAVYTAVLTTLPGEIEGLWQLSITICTAPASDQGPIYKMKTGRYFPGEVSP